MRRIWSRAPWQLESTPQWAWGKITARYAPTRIGQGLIAIRGRQTLVCIGDSHLKPMIIAKQQRMLPETVLAVTVVDGATASGLGNPNSVTQALPKFRLALRSIRSSSTVMVVLGEVDAGFLVFLRSDQSSEPVRFFTDDALHRFKQFLTTEILSKGSRLILVSAVLPVVSDYTSWEGLGQARVRVTANRDERAAETRYWNDQCRLWCAEEGATWLDLMPHVIGDDGHITIDWFAGPRDHHLDLNRHAKLLVDLLRAEGFG